jgi:hypothetical protein
MNPSLEYFLFAILFLSQGYILYKLELIKFIIDHLTRIAGKLTDVSIENTEDIKKLKK